MEGPKPEIPKRRTRLYSLTRLAIGGALAGYDGLMNRLVIWESEQDQRNAAQVLTIPDSGDPLAEPTTDQGGGDTQADRLRHAAIGAVFDAQEAFGSTLETVDRVTHLAGKFLGLTVGPIYSSRPLSPLRHRIDRLAQRGQREVDRWIELGRKEEFLGRELANTALKTQVDSSIEYLTSNEEVQELVQSHSVGLIGEIVEETRERTISADNYLEAWVRTMFRRPMRSELPAPPPEIVARAMPLRSIQGKIVKK